MDGGHAKDALYEQFARLAKAVAHPKRIEILEILAQGERSVERLAAVTGMGMTNTSAQLQVLRQAHLLESRKDGPRVLYRLADDQVAGFVAGLRDLARARLAEVDRLARDYFDDPTALEPLSRAELVDRAERGEVVILDVRPAEEFAAGHIPGAVSAPLDGEFDRVVARLRKRQEIVAYCRGPYCVLAPEAVELLRQRGLRGRRLAEGMPEWRRAGLPVAFGEE
jgi:rhodanese-related sulfurtransferase/DNA-binding transcriptional ArsR family regulator